MSEQIEGRNAVLEAFVGVWISCLFWMDARMDQSVPLQERPAKKIPLSIMYPEKDWIS